MEVHAELAELRDVRRLAAQPARVLVVGAELVVDGGADGGDELAAALDVLVVGVALLPVRAADGALLAVEALRQPEQLAKALVQDALLQRRGGGARVGARVGAGGGRG